VAQLAEKEDALTAAAAEKLRVGGWVGLCSWLIDQEHHLKQAQVALLHLSCVININFDRTGSLQLSQAISRLEEAIEAGRVDLERSLAERAALQAVREATEREVARLNAELMAVGPLCHLPDLCSLAGVCLLQMSSRHFLYHAAVHAVTFHLYRPPSAPSNLPRGSALICCCYAWPSVTAGEGAAAAECCSHRGC
jgi:hypothetical protein